MTNVESSLSDLTNEIKVHGAIVIVGAGISFEAGLPLYNQLAPLIWQVVDEFPSIKDMYKRDRTLPAKLIIGNSIENLKNAFNFIENNVEAVLRFKELFKILNDKHHKNPSISHQYLCQLIHAGYIKIVVSFNWDDLLEMAWEQLYGTQINDNKNNLLKPHGDVRNVNSKWIFPNSSGEISVSDKKSISLASENTPCTFIILGYSESDPNIVDQLIEPNEVKNKVFRISPSAIDSIPLMASEALNSIVNNLLPKVTDHWIHLDFSNQVGLEHAIMGYRLRESDVLACPKLPQFSEAKYKLEQAHSVIIESDPGCGKSITAYQLAYDFLISGWEVIKYDNTKIISCSDVKLKNNGYKTVYIIDDAQQLDKGVINKLLGYANNTRKIIITQTHTFEFPSESVSISKEQSVKTIYNHYLKNKSTIVPIVAKINKKVNRKIGDLYMDTPFEYILNLASHESTPWLFNYSLRGGWENTKNQYSIAKEYKCSDILLTLIAFKQIISLDKPVEKNWLIESVQIWKYNSDWCNKCLNFMFREKMILSLNEIRTMHLQAAIRIVICFVENHSVEECQPLFKLIKSEMLNKNTPLQGVLWFFNLLFGFETKYKILYNILNKEYCYSLLDRCMVQTDSSSILYGIYVIDNVIHRDGQIKYREICKKYNNTLKLWMEQVNNNTAYSLSLILNDMINEDKDWKVKWVECLNISSIFQNLRNINTKYLYDWASFIDRLSACQKRNWKNKFYLELPKREIELSLSKTIYTDISGMMKMIYTLLQFDKAYGHKKFIDCLPIISQALHHNFSDVLADLGLDFLMFICGENLFGIGHPDKLQKQSTKAFINCIKPEMISSCLLTKTPRDYERLYRFIFEIHCYDPEKMKIAVQTIDFKILDEYTVDLWKTQPREFSMLINMISMFRLKEVDDWIFSHCKDMDFLRPTLVAISPQTVEQFLNENKEIFLVEDKQNLWSLSACAVKKLKAYDKNVCKEVIHKNGTRIKKSLLELTPLDWEDYFKFFSQLIKADLTFVNSIFEEINLENLKIIWIDKMNSTQYPDNKQKKALQGFKRLLVIIQNATDDIELNKVIICLKSEVNERLINAH
ncbi:hypothetical protein [Clostridium ljungdahlii]|uniref:Novel STAND NTPase 3 domain-containing protein n=1 Tax=Clostridium ljungdahlii TaxID=1538 RepID=A0A168LQQ2_9CLOT|nr:hypothetical protein [Clostridium ljungdahlii]OAA83567.1 hypothetical protein WY13_03354 [Clostridium ljungdahlii]